MASCSAVLFLLPQIQNVLPVTRDQPSMEIDSEWTVQHCVPHADGNMVEHRVHARTLLHALTLLGMVCMHGHCCDRVHVRTVLHGNTGESLRRRHFPVHQFLKSQCGSFSANNEATARENQSRSPAGPEEETENSFGGSKQRQREATIEASSQKARQDQSRQQQQQEKSSAEQQRC